MKYTDAFDKADRLCYTLQCLGYKLLGDPRRKIALKMVEFGDDLDSTWTDEMTDIIRGVAKMGMPWFPWELKNIHD